jgi:hypothetical protein
MPSRAPQSRGISPGKHRTVSALLVSILSWTACRQRRTEWLARN